MELVTWKNHYWHNRGATLKEVKRVCVEELGGIASRWNDLRVAFEVVKARIILK